MARSAGAMRDLMHFQARPAADDGFGHMVPGAGEFETQFTAHVGLAPRTGSEAVTAARLEGRQPFVVTMRWMEAARDITTAWQLVDARDQNRVLNVTSPPADPDGRRQWLEFLATDGVAS